MSKSSDRIASEIRAEMRAIIRLRDDLRKPFGPFSAVPSKDDGSNRDELCLRVVFADRPWREFTGLKARMKRLSVPDERIEGKVYGFAQAVWHLKDRLHQWVQEKKMLFVDVESEAKKSTNLLICSDLANWKKHGRNQNHSGLCPRLGNVIFDTSRNGLLEFFYEGATKEKELLVSELVPIPYTIDLLIHGGLVSIGNGIEVISQAFDDWLPLIEKLCVLADDNPESDHLRRVLFPARSVAGN